MRTRPCPHSRLVGGHEEATHEIPHRLIVASLARTTQARAAKAAETAAQASAVVAARKARLQREEEETLEAKREAEQAVRLSFDSPLG